MKDGIRQTVGKRITGILVAENTKSPTQQVFVLFDDDTYFEFYGESFTGAGGVDKGDAAEAARYATEVMGAKITAAYPESLLRE